MIAGVSIIRVCQREITLVTICEKSYFCYWILEGFALYIIFEFLFSILLLLFYVATTLIYHNWEEVLEITYMSLTYSIHNKSKTFN